MFGKFKLGWLPSLIVLSCFWSNVALSQNKVVVVPLGSDVSAKQFNDLVAQVNQNHVFSGFVESDGTKGGFGHYTSSRDSEGVYSINVFPSPEFDISDLGEPSIVVSSKGVHRIAKISDVSKGAPVSGNVSQLAFKVTLAAHDGTIANADFYFHVQFAEFSSQIDGPSDKRLKLNVKNVGKTSKGFGLYQFNYIGDSAKASFVGVMAQEIIKTHPRAVSRAEDGFYRVNYFKLGLRMSTYENWKAFGLDAVEMKYESDRL